MPAFVCCHKVSLTEFVSGWLFVMRGEVLFVVCCCDALLLLLCIVLVLFIVVVDVRYGFGIWRWWWYIAAVAMHCLLLTSSVVGVMNCLVAMQCRCCCALKCSVIVLSSPSLIHPPSNHSFIHAIIHLSTFHSFIHLPFVVWTIDYVHSFINSFIPTYLPTHLPSFFHSSILSFIPSLLHSWIRPFLLSIESSHNDVAKQYSIERVERFSHIHEKVCSHYENWSH